MLNTQATQHIKATLAAFGPGDAMGMTQDTWAKLHEAMSVLIEQSAQQEPLTPEWIFMWLRNWCDRHPSLRQETYNSLYKMVSDARAIE